MDWREVGSVAAKAAPVLGAVLGGPVGAIAGAAGTLLASALGVEASPEAVNAALQDPQALVRVREIEAEERARLLDWQARQVEAELRDVADARAMQVAVVQAGHGSAWVMPVLAVLVVMAFISVVIAVIFLGPQGLGEAGSLLVGGLISAVMSVLGYYFGSSLGSSRKTDLMSKGCSL